MLDDDHSVDSSQKNSLAPSTTQSMTQIVYLLQIISLFTGGLFALIPLMINYIYRKNTRDNWLDDHFRWQIQTFWFSSIFYLIGSCFLIIPFVGWFISGLFFFLASLIVLVRVIKGWKNFTNKLPPNY